MLALDPGAWEPETWTAVAAWVTVLVYVVIAVLALRQVKEARRLREEQGRPFVVVDLDVSWLIQLTISNIGSTIARNVRIDFEPALQSTMGRPWPWEESSLFRDGIPTLPPGKRIALPFDTSIQRLGSDLPLSYAVKVHYWGAAKTRFTDDYVLDLGPFKGASPPADGIPEVVRAIEKLHSEIKEWTDGTRGIAVTAQIENG